MFAKLETALAQRTYLSLSDFDNHLEDNTKDWFNASINMFK